MLIKLWNAWPVWLPGKYTVGLRLLWLVGYKPL